MDWPGMTQKGSVCAIQVGLDWPNMAAVRPPLQCVTAAATCHCSHIVSPLLLCVTTDALCHHHHIVSPPPHCLTGAALCHHLHISSPLPHHFVTIRWQ